MNFRPFLIILFMSFVVLASGCASKSYAVLVESPDGSTGAIIVSNAKGATLINEKNRAVALGGFSSQPFGVQESRLKTDFSDALSAEPALPKSFLIYFKLGATTLTPESEAMIPTVLETIRSRGQAAVSVIGHTDTVGDDRVNEKLAYERAQLIAGLLQANGLKTIELIVNSHGERNLLIKTADNVPEPRNRRVEVTVR
jgi:outer membrane protein OmpA-like peptidoglycan-associated protein